MAGPAAEIEVKLAGCLDTAESRANLIIIFLFCADIISGACCMHSTYMCTCMSPRYVWRYARRL